MPPERVNVPRERLILPSLMLGGLFSSATFTSISPFLSEIAADLDVSIGLAGQVTSASSLAAVLPGLAIAPFASSLPPKRVLISLLAVVGAGSIGSGLVPWFPSLLALQFITGAASSMIAATALMTLGATIREPKQRAKQQGLVLGSLGLGPLLVTPVLRWAADYSSWQAGVRLYGLLALVVAGVLATIHPTLPVVRSRQRLSFRSRIQDAATAMRLPGITATVCTSFLVWSSWGLIGTFLAGFFLDAYSGADSMVSVLWLADGLGYLIGATIGGAVIARVANPSRSLLAGLIAMTAAIVPFAWIAVAPLATIVTFFTWVVALGIATNAIIALYDRLGERHTPSLLFLDSAIGKVAILVGSIAGGMAINSSAGYRAWATLLLVTTLAGALPVGVLARTSRRHRATPAINGTAHGMTYPITTSRMTSTAWSISERDTSR